LAIPNNAVRSAFLTIAGFLVYNIDAVQVQCFVVAGKSCDVRPSNRRKCGFHGILKRTCYSKGCCWDTQARDAPPCFHPAPITTESPVTTKPPPQPNCNVGHPKNRVNCGFSGVTEKTCLAKGCCYDSTEPGVPWCFYGVETTLPPTTTKQPQPNCNVGNPKKRVNCGFSGVTENTCLAKGCCYDSTVRGVPWCFYGVQTTVPPTTTKQPEPRCDVGSPSKRQNCGFTGMHPYDCRDRNCCWDDSVPGVPWCFFGKSTTPQEPNCDVGLPSMRQNCGFKGIHQEECHERNCCFDDSVPDVPWCFFGKATTPDCDVGPRSMRRDCGFMGIQQDECHERNCCWDDSVPGVPWCFFGARSTTTASTTIITTTVATTVKPATPPPISHCYIAVKYRKPCGSRNIGKEQCVAIEGCCWRRSFIFRVPSCYLAASTPAPGGCNPHLPHRLTCGYLGINKTRCSAIGCCWDDSVPSRPKCYRRNTGQWPWLWANR